MQGNWMVRSQEPYSSTGTKLSHPIACQTLAKSSYILLAAKIGNCQRPTSQTGLVLCNPNHVRSDLQSPFVTRFGRGMSSPAYKYKGYGRLRSFYPIESINLHFSHFSSNLSFSNLVLFFARLDGVQRHLGWLANLKTTLDLRAMMGYLPSLRF